MESSELIFRSIAVLHGIFGFLAFGLATSEDIKPPPFHDRRNPLAGDSHRFLALGSCWSLIACGLLAFAVPAFSVAAAWLSVVLYSLAGSVGATARAKAPHFFKFFSASVAVRIFGAGALSVALGLQRAG